MFNTICFWSAVAITSAVGIRHRGWFGLLLLIFSGAMVVGRLS